MLKLAGRRRIGPAIKMIVGHLERHKTGRFAPRSAHRARQRCFYPDPLFPFRSRSCMGTAAPIRFIGFRVRAAPCVFPSYQGGRRNPAGASSSIIRLRGAPSHLTNVSSRSHIAPFASAPRSREI